MYYEDFEVLIKPQAIKNAIGEFFECDIEYFMVKSRKMEKTFLRHLTRYFMYKYCGISEKTIARLTRTSDHSSTYHSCKTIENFLFIGDAKTESAVLGITELLMRKYSVELIRNAESTSMKRKIPFADYTITNEPITSN